MFGNYGATRLIGVDNIGTSNPAIIRQYKFDEASQTFVSEVTLTLSTLVSGFSNVPSLSMKYLANGETFLFPRSDGTNLLQYAQSTRDFNKLASAATPNFNGNANTYCYAYSEKSNVAVCISAVTTINDLLVLQGPGLHPIGGQVFPLLFSNPIAADIHPNDEAIFVARSNAAFYYVNNGSFDTGQGIVPKFNTASPQTIPLNGTVVVGGWTKDGKRLVIGYTNGVIDVFDWDSTAKTLTLAGSNTLGISGTLVSMAMRWDGRFFAFGSLNGGTYTTGIYTRKGPWLTQIINITGMGKLLNFNADGMLLVDTTAGKCYKYDKLADNFEDFSTSMVNVSTTMFRQTINEYIPYSKVNGYLYPVVKDTIASKTLFSDCKVKLLNNSAVFDSTHTTIEQVDNSQTYEIFGNGWPAGGVALSNLHYGVNADGFTSLLADAVKQQIDDSFQYYKAAVYEVSTSKPIAFLDFLGVQRTQKQTTFVMDFSINGLAQLRS